MTRARPRISVCSMTNVAPEQVAATLAPLSALGAEVVLAADDRVPRTWVDGYRRLADRVLLVGFPGFFGQMYAWLAAQCSGEWLLQLDADEVPAPGLAAEVLATIDEGEATHAWISRHWLYPDAEHTIAEWPWRPDYSLRLLRNDPALVRFPGVHHLPVTADGPKRYLREPIYHADLLLADVAARRRKVERYERARPGLLVQGRSINEAFYLPELRAAVRTEAVPERDAVAVRRLLDGGGRLPRRRRGRVARAGADEVTRRWEQRSLGEDAYRARLQLVDDDLRVVAGDRRTFDVEVENLGSERWPGGMDRHPQIRVAYRWIGGGELVEEGLRTGFGAAVRPGERVLVPVEVLGPDEPGERTIEIDVVHEHVRWFGAGVRARVVVERPAAASRADSLVTS